MQLKIKKAQKRDLKLRMTLNGPPGSGKTYTALLFAAELGARILVIDTEAGSASRYADRFEFDVIELEHYSPDSYVQAIRLAEQEGYDVLIVDSLSHAWRGAGGVLDIAGGKFTGWKEARPAHQKLIDTLLNCKMHVIATMRTKVEYVVDVDERTKKQTIQKAGTAAIQDDTTEYEFDIVGDMDHSHTMSVGKTRCPALDGKRYRQPDAEVMRVVKAWLAGTDNGPEQVHAEKAVAPEPQQRPANGKADGTPRETIQGIVLAIRDRSFGRTKGHEIDLDTGDEAAVQIYAKMGSDVAQVEPGTTILASCVVSDSGVWWVQSHEVIAELAEEA